ncbi:MAG TPA: ATP-dependent DNA ligase [Streptosporangiaceae bacterium]|nr:ATP-dependent DNA ligase [Streptosporangiaceae bacterium]
MRLPVLPPVAPMLAKAVTDIPADQFYEPKWDGFRSIVFRDGDEVEIGSRNERPMTRYFPEVAAAVRRHLPPRCVIDGEIVIADPGKRGLDFGALQLRLHPAASRVRLLAERTPAAFIAFDLLALGDVDYMPRPFAERRAVLERALAEAAPPIHLTPITRDIERARHWFELFEGAGLDGLIAKRGDLTYEPNKRVMTKIKHERTADCVVVGYRPHKSGPDAIGSLLLGLYNDDGTLEDQIPPEARRAWFGERPTSGALVPVGVVGAFPMARRRELFAELQPLVTDFAGHPWHWGAGGAGEGDRARRRGEASRWNPTKDLSFVPLRPERVVEVRYDHMEGMRFRHMAQFVRWRPDRDPASCGYAQLVRPVEYDLTEILAGRVG